ncbi:MAG: hypothetical protein HY400_04145 [Elusimicrobia bacterium]|nr:hypothetical protein [Elusimicrobiota bacterium]
MNHPAELLVLKRLLSLSPGSRQALIRDFEKTAQSLKFLNRASSRSPIVPHPLALTPFVLSKRWVGEVQDLVSAVYRFQLKIPELYRWDAYDLRKICHLGPVSESWFQKLIPFPLGRQHLLIRVDVGLRAGNQEPVLYETNATALGGLYLHCMGVRVLERFVFKILGLGTASLGLKPPPDLMDYIWRWMGEPEGIPIAFVEDLPFNDSYSEVPQILECFRRKGAKAYHGHPRQIRLKDSRTLLHGKSVGLVYRDMPFKDMARLSRDGNRRYAGLLELLSRGSSFPGLTGEFDHKGILECFTSKMYQPLFSRQEAALFKKYVPWTRVLWERKTESPEEVGVDLFPYVRKNKDRFVLKPNQDAGGEGVLFGMDVPQARWEKALDKAAQGSKSYKKWIVQSYAESDRRWMAYLMNREIHFQNCYSSIGVFYSSQGAGLHCRISKSKVVNVARGGALACVFTERGSSHSFRCK